MRMLKASVLALAVLATPVIAGETSEKKAPDPDKVVCKVDRSVGSSISERVCKTRAQWDLEREAARRNLQDSHMNTDPAFLKSRGGG